MKFAGHTVTKISQDSRSLRDSQVQSTLFFAIEGTNRDGHDFVEEALEAGVLAVVVRKNHPKILSIKKDKRFQGKIFEAEDPREHFAKAAADLYKNPTEKLIVIGVTGTNGKTTCTYLLESILNEWNKSPAVIGTVENRFGKYKLPSTHTTPDALSLQKIFSEFHSHGAQSVAMEVSSHALDQKRTIGTRFTAALFTNLTQDHLDYHQTMENYFLAKLKLFNDYAVPIKVVNADDAYGKRIVEVCNKNGQSVLTYGLKHNNVNYYDLHFSAQGIRGNLHVDLKEKGNFSIPIHSPLLGQFNAANLAGAAAVGIGLGIPPETITSALSKVQVPGRMQTVANSKGKTIVVDYAHTPDALEKALKALRPICTGKLICIFGCGGDRDKSKRPIMGSLVEQLADTVIITSDNPRTENPESIIDEIFKGLKSKALRISDRKQAIYKGIEISSAQDILLIAGKGHENYQIIGTEKLQFDDRLIALEALKSN